MKAGPLGAIGVIRLSQMKPPATWSNQEAKALFDAAVFADEAGWVDDERNPTGVCFAPPPQDPAMSPYGTPVDVSEQRARARIRELQQEVCWIEQYLRADGVPFVQGLQFAKPSDADNDAEAFLVDLLGRPHTHIKVAGQLFVRGRDGLLQRESYG